MKKTFISSGAVRNFTFLNISTISANVAAFFTSVLIGRYLPREEFGKFVFIFAFVTLFNILTDLGLSQLSVREVSQNRSSAGKFLINIGFLKSLLCGITLAAIFASAGFFKLSYLRKELLVIGLAVVFESFGRFFTFIFNAFERMGYTAALTFLLKFFTLLGVFFAVKAKTGLLSILWVYVFSSAIFALLALVFLVKKIIPKFAGLDFRFCRKIIAKGLPFALLLLLLVVYNKFDLTLLKFFKGEVSCAIYGAANYILMALMFITANLGATVYPAFSRFYKEKNNEELFRYYRNSFYFLFALGLPIAVGTTLLSQRLTLLIWSSKYIESAGVLKILAWRTSLEYLTAIFTALLLATERQKVIVAFMFIMVVTNIALNFILIPRYSYFGASISSLASMGLHFILCLAYISKNIYRFNFRKTLIKPAFAAFLLAFFIHFFGGINLFLLILLAVVFYFFSLFFLGALKVKDLR